MTLLDVNKGSYLHSLDFKMDGLFDQQASRESDFYMHVFKIQPCPIKTTHPWEHCCYAHPHENARRRDPRKYRYIAEPCPDYKHGICLLGSQCPYAHGVYERNLHPSKYRTQLCTEGDHCCRRVCFFAHTPFQLRASSHIWSIAEAEYVRQVLLERIIRESEQAALREQAAAALAATRSMGINSHAFFAQQRGGGASPLSAMHLQQQQQAAAAAHMQMQMQQHISLQQHAAAQQAAASFPSVMSPFQQQQLQQHQQMMQGLGEGASMLQTGPAALRGETDLAASFTQDQIVGSPTSLQLPATPPAAAPLPARNTSSSPVRTHQDAATATPTGSAQASASPGVSPGEQRATSPELRRCAAAGLRLRNAMSQPVPDMNGAEVMGGDLGAASGTLFQAGAGLPTASQATVRAHRAGRAATEDGEGPRMSMAMRRQLGIAPAKSPSKASSAAMASALSGAASGQLRSRGSPSMSPGQSGTLPGHIGLVGQHQPEVYNAVSQGLLLQQATLALQMAHLSPLPVANPGLEGDLTDAGSAALAAALRQQGASLSSEVSAEDYSELIGRLHGMRFSFLGDAGGSLETTATSSGTVTTGYGDEDLRTASGCSTSAPFDMDLSPSQNRSPHQLSPEACQPVATATSAAMPNFEQLSHHTSFFSY